MERLDRPRNADLANDPPSLTDDNAASLCHEETGDSSTQFISAHDAWSRLVRVEYETRVTAECTYNGLNWRIVKRADTDLTSTQPSPRPAADHVLSGKVETVPTFHEVEYWMAGDIPDSTRRDLSALVRSAFPEVPIPRRKKIVESCDLCDPDSREIVRDFGKRKWTEISFETLLFHRDSLFMMSETGIRYYLPA